MASTSSLGICHDFVGRRVDHSDNRLAGLLVEREAQVLRHRRDHLAHFFHNALDFLARQLDDRRMCFAHSGGLRNRTGGG